MRKRKFLTCHLALLSLMCSTPVFATENQGATPSTEVTPVSGSLGLSADGGYDPNPPSDLNKKSEITNSYFGISYYPSTFDFDTTKLLDEVNTQTILAKREQNKTFNIGVKDKRRETTNEWTLSVKLEKRVGSDNEGIALKLGNTGEAKRNINDGSQDFQKGELTDQLKKDGVSEVSTKKDRSITISSLPIMHTNKGKFVNGVYDLELGDVTLVIPDASKVSPQQINTTVQWNLENTPTKEDELIEDLKEIFTGPDYIDLKTDVDSQLLTDVEKKINNIEDEYKKQYNKQYFEKYAKGHLVHWNSRTDGGKFIGSVKLITNSTNSRAGIFFDNYDPKLSNSKDKTTIYYRLTRDDQTVIEQSIDINDIESQKNQTEVQPGDILTIHHDDGIRGHVSNYPNTYIDGYMTNDNELKYKVTDNFQLEPVK